MAPDGATPHREVFVYWRLRPADLEAALVALRGLHDRLRSAHPGLGCSLYRRVDTQAEATLMEVYRTGVPGDDRAAGTGLLSALRGQGDVATAPWRRGPRQLEVFDALDPFPPGSSV